MKRCAHCARPGLDGWLRSESRRWRWCAAVQDCVSPRALTSLGYQEGRRVFWEGPKCFELCPIVLNNVQHNFPGWAINFPPWLRARFHLSSDITLLLILCTILLNKATQDLLRYTAQNLEMTGYMQFQIKRKLQNLTLCSATQIIICLKWIIIINKYKL